MPELYDYEDETDVPRWVGPAFFVALLVLFLVAGAVGMA